MNDPIPPDEVLIESLEVQAHVGVPDDELAHAQRLLVDVNLTGRISFESLGDDIAAAVDYDAVCRTVREAATARPRRLIETLAADLAAAILDAHPVLQTTVCVRKFVVDGTDAVGVRCTRRAG